MYLNTSEVLLILLAGNSLSPTELPHSYSFFKVKFKSYLFSRTSFEYPPWKREIIPSSVFTHFFSHFSTIILNTLSYWELFTYFFTCSLYRFYMFFKIWSLILLGLGSPKTRTMSGRRGVYEIVIECMFIPSPD